MTLAYLIGLYGIVNGHKVLELPLRRPDRKARWQSFVKEGIHDAVVQLLARTPDFGVLTMEDVAREAGVSKGTLYLYFEDKDGLFRSGVEAALAPLERELLGVLECDLPPDLKLATLVLTNLRFFDEHRELFRIYLYGRQRSYLGSELHPGHRLFVKRVADVLTQGMEAGLFRSFPAVKLAEMWIEAMLAVIRQRLFSEAPAPLEDDARLFLEVFLHGVETPAPSS